MITFIDKDDDFTIHYVSKNLYSSLNYNSNELIGKPVNILLPVHLYDLHKYIMKKFSLFSNISYKKKTFIIDKKKYIKDTIFKAHPIPTIEKKHRDYFQF